MIVLTTEASIHVSILQIRHESFETRGKYLIDTYKFKLAEIEVAPDNCFLLHNSIKIMSVLAYPHLFQQINDINVKKRITMKRTIF
jgi:hypothetical protein